MLKKIAPALLAMLVTTALAAPAQTGDVKKVLSEARAALGGDKKLDGVKTLTLTGRTLRTGPTGNTIESEFEATAAFPDKYVRRDVMANLGNQSIYRVSGFNGDGVINEIDQPPQLAGGGNVIIRMAGPGGSLMGQGQPLTPEQKQLLLTASKQDFARLMLGIFAGSSSTYPLTMTYAGQAESPDGKADIIEVKGEGDFAVKLFIDAKTHLPLMLSWMAKEPLVIQRTSGGPGGGQTSVSGGGGQTFVSSGGGMTTFSRGTTGGSPQAAPAKPPTPEEAEKVAKQLEEERKAADAKRRTVEYRLFYADYKDVDGVMIPFRLQRSIDGKPTEELSLDKVKVNGKVDEKKFQVSK
jgi:hypothetical protein